MAQLIYEQPIYPKNRYLQQQPGHHAEFKKDVLEKQIKLMQDKGIWKPPSKN